MADVDTIYFAAQASDGKTRALARVGSEVKSGLLVWSKTGTGTCDISVIETQTAAIMGNEGAVVSIAANAQKGYVEFPMPASMRIELSSVSGSVSVDAQIDGAQS